jgi:hypothetical protein
VTEIQGIFQGDLIVRTAIMTMLDNVYNDTSLLDYIFQSLLNDPLTVQSYGAEQIQQAKNWFLNTNIPVFMAFRVAEEAIPCITISLQESQEAEYTHGDVHYVPQEQTAADWPALSPPFTPIGWSPSTGIMILPPGLMGDQIIAPGMLIQTRAGRQYTILQNYGDDEIGLAPNTTGDFVNAVIVGGTPQLITTIESMSFKETYQIGLHVMGNPTFLIFLHTVLSFCLLKYKQDLLEGRGFERSQIVSTDFRRNMEFEMEEVFSRYISITGYVRQYWPKNVVQAIASVESQLIVSPPYDDENPPVDDQGNPPGTDTSWSVRPQ